jgi:ATP phosphoribosyltransferase regulatory subunit
VLRARASQLDPARERIQAGAELVGSDDVPAIAELIQVALAALTDAGVTDLMVDLTTPDLVARLAETCWPVADLAALLEALDGKDAGALVSEDMAPYRVLLDCAGDATTALAALQPLDPLLATWLEALTAALPPDTRVTIDPAERHGFDYQGRIGFSLFGSANGQPFAHEIGRGGAYRVRHPDGQLEPAAGVSLYVDPLVDAGLGQAPRRRIFLPFGTSAAIGDALRAEGWATVAALSMTDGLGQCTHVWRDGAPVATG